MEKRDTNLVVGFASVVFLVVAAFGLGVLLGQGAKTNSSLGTINGNDAYSLEYLSNLYQQVQQNYLGDFPSSEDVTYGMARGLVEALNDKYSAFFNPTEAADYVNSADSAFDGIGVQLGYDGQYTVIETPIAGYPGQVAGLLAGDLVLKVDGEDVTGVRPELVATKIRGESGTKVGLTIYRSSTGEALDFEIERARIDLENISYTQLEDGIVQISIVKFTEGATDDKDGVEVFNEQWDTIAAEVAALNPTGIVLDLRSNPGGYVEAVKHVAEEFLPNGQVILKEQEKGATAEQTFTDSRSGRFESIPLVVLVDSASASASEILAAAIQDNDRGTIVGEKTVGKGVEQKMLDFSDGSILLVTFRRWLTPNGLQISAESPITPDEIVEYQAPGATDTYDNQMQKALDLLTQ